MKKILDRHYKGLASDYDKYLYYSPQFVRTLTEKMIRELDLKAEDTFVDLCGGTGMYSVDIHKQIKFGKPTLCVDPYSEMLAKIPTGYNIVPICEDAMTFSSDSHQFNKVLIKEAIHHIENRPCLFTNLFRCLPREGRLLLVHVPPDVQYPIFQKALERARGWHACPNELEQHLREAGFRVERDFIDFPHKISKEHYFDQVRTQFMTVLSSFNKSEMAAGLKEMEERYKNADVLEFTDHFDYLTGIKE